MSGENKIILNEEEYDVTSETEMSFDLTIEADGKENYSNSDMNQNEDIRDEDDSFY